MRWKIMAGVCLAAIGWAAAQTAGGTAEEIDAARANVGKWIGVQRILAKERADWQQAKQVLESRITVVEKEIAQLEEKIALTRKVGAESDQRVGGAEAEIAALKKDAGLLEGRISGLEERTRGARSLLPEPLREKLKPLYDRMPVAGSAAKVSVAERFQNVLGILNELNRANGDISQTTEIRSLSDGKPSEVKAVYLGLGQAYYLSATGEAGVGRPGEDGWTWQAEPSHADSIARMFDILESKSSPAFVPLPVRIQ